MTRHTWDARSRQYFAQNRLFETSMGYLERTGKTPSEAQLRYWGRGGKKTPKVLVKNIKSIRRYVRGVEKGWYRYTLVARIAGKDGWQRNYDIEWKLVYYRPEKFSFMYGYDKERRGARAAMEIIAEENQTHIPENAVTSAEGPSPDSSFKPGDPAIFTVRDNARQMTNKKNMLVKYEKVIKIDNHKVLEAIDKWKKTG